MSTPIAQTDIYTDFQGLAGLRARAKDNDRQALREVAGQFEALFVQMMMKSMRDASLGEGLLDSEAGDTYQGMFDRQIAIELSKGQGLGLAEMMVRQLSRGPEAAAPVSPAVQSPAPRFTPASGETAVQRSGDRPPALKAQADWRPASPAEFVNDLWPHARQAARRLGVGPEVLIAQAALETGWGQSMIRGADGRNSFNLFGIKADARWQGERVLTDTVEYRDGLMRKERAIFRAYDSPAESFADYADFIRSHPRYRLALERAADAGAYTRALQQAGYATDPDYASKIDRIIQSERLQEPLTTVKMRPPEPLI